jgi:NADPH:quinone reductase-like Zn-dependent oxidoreductase
MAAARAVAPMRPSPGLRWSARFEEVIAPVDLVDLTGGDTLARSFGMIVPGGALGRWSSRRPLSGTPARGSRLLLIVEPDREQLAELARRIDPGRLRVVIDRVFPLAEARSAFEYAQCPSPREERARSAAP